MFDAIDGMEETERLLLESNAYYARWNVICGCDTYILVYLNMLYRCLTRKKLTKNVKRKTDYQEQKEANTTLLQK